MRPARIRDSLQAKLLVAVVVCALLPLAALGMWLSTSAVRSGELLLRTQLDSTASRSALVVQQRWAIRKSDALMLTTNAPVRAALERAGADGAPEYARRAFATMPGIASVTVKDASDHVRWRLGDASGYTARTSDPTGQPSGEAPSSVLRVAVRDESARTLGQLEARIRLDALVSPLPTMEVAPSQFIAYHDRNTGASIVPTGVPANAFDGEHFDWNGHRWLAVRQRLDDPPIDVVAAAQLDPFLVPFTSTARAGALALALSAAIVVLLTIVVTSRLTRSLGQLALAADRVSHGALDTRIQSASEDEVGRVARAFDGMLESIARMMRELSQREAIAAMGELAATMAHQVRSPATAVRLDVQRAHDKLPSDAPERALLARALTQLDRMERAVSASLKLARTSRTDFADLDVREPLGRAVAGVRAECTRLAVAVDISVMPHEALHVHGDAASLEQLFGNVLTNAVQASPAGRRVHLSVEANGGPHLTIRVRDDGAGMTADVLRRAGEPLFSTKPEGTGLGLAIARRIAAAHGGTVSLESESGHGTTVVVALPRSFVPTELALR